MIFSAFVCYFQFFLLFFGLFSIAPSLEETSAIFWSFLLFFGLLFRRPPMEIFLPMPLTVTAIFF